jgi:hypothetical protein
MKWIRESALPFLIRMLPDFMVIAGAVCVVHGLAMIYAPLAWVVAGAALLFVGWLGVLRERARPRSEEPT